MDYYNKNNSKNNGNNEYEDLLNSYSEDFDIKSQRIKKPPTVKNQSPVNKVDRSQKVQNFSLNFDADHRNKYDDKPTYKGEVYFSSQPARRPQDKSRKKGLHPSKLKLSATAKKLVTILSIILIFSIFTSLYAISCLNDIFAMNRENKIVTVTIPESATSLDVVKILDKNDLINQRFFCNIFALVMGYNEDSFLNGMYYLNPKMGLEGMLMQLKETPKTAETVTLTFPEGWTTQEIIDKLVRYEVCDRAILEVTLKKVDFDYDFLNNMENIEQRYQRFEGYLYPNTYDFYVGENGSSVIRRFLNVSRDKWTEKYEERANELGMTRDEIITLASIIQEEAANKEQMPLISSVIHNRLNRSVDFPLLQCDATGLYLENNIKPNVDSSAFDEYKKLYDTAYCEGLPVGPICNPGNDAIEAALYPGETDYLYFCHDNNRKIYMAKTYAEHRTNWLEVLRVNNS